MIYHINEFEVESDFLLPGDAVTRRSIAGDALALRRGSVAEIPCLLRQIRSQLIYDVGDGFVLALSSLSMHVSFRGTSITIDCPEENLPIATAWLINFGFGSATLFRGGVPLHGAGLMMNGRYFVITAPSGTGKSTLSSYLVSEQDVKFGNDDLVPVRIHDGTPVAYPSVSLFPKLRGEAIDRNGLDRSTLLRADYGRGEEEYFVPLPPERRVVEATPLSAIFILRPETQTNDLTSSNNRQVVSRLPDEEASEFIRKNLHAVGRVERWLDGDKLSHQCHEVAAGTSVFSISYTRSFDILPFLANAIRSTLASL